MYLLRPYLSIYPINALFLAEGKNWGKKMVISGKWSGFGTVIKPHSKCLLVWIRKSTSILKCSFCAYRESHKQTVAPTKWQRIVSYGENIFITPVAEKLNLKIEMHHYCLLSTSFLPPVLLFLSAGQQFSLTLHCRAAFCPFLHRLSLRWHHPGCEAQLSPLVCWLELAWTSCVWHEIAPAAPYRGCPAVPPASSWAPAPSTAMRILNLTSSG